MRVQAAAQAEVEASPTMLRQAIENLIDNAAAHGGPGGVEVDVRADPAAGQVEVVVADRGGAEAPEGGHGIGLFVVRRFLDEAGGTPGLRPATVAAPSSGCACRCGQPPNRIHWTTPSTPERPSRGERSMRQPVRVVLADDHDAFVEGLGMVLSAEDDLEVVALAGDGASALQAVLTHHPDVLVVDTQMPGPAVTELVRLVGQAEPATRVLLLAEDARLAPSSRPDPGGHAGMTRAVSARELAEAIRAVAAGFRVTLADPPAPVAARRRGGSAEPTSPRTGPSGTTTPSCCCAACPERERQVLALLARGYSNRRIAEACFLSLNTVRTHVPERAGQAGRTLQAGGGRAGRAPGAGPHRGPDRLGAPVPNLEVVDVRGCRSARSSQLPQGRRRRRGRRAARLALLALAPRRRPGRHPGGARGPAGPAAGRAGRRGHLPTDRTRTWLGPAFWANRLQDWRLHQGRVECVAATGPMRTRTVAVLTRELVAGDLPARIGVRTGTLAAGEGFSGFLVGAGGGRLDHRAAALVQGASGEGGGILCTYEADGSVGFREHTDEARQFAYAPLPGTVHAGQPRPRALEEDVELVLELIPRGRGRFRLRLTGHRRRRGDAGRGPPRRGRRGRPDRRDRARVVLGRGRRRGPPLVRRPRHRRGQGGQAAGAGRGARSSAPSTPSTGRC